MLGLGSRLHLGFLIFTLRPWRTLRETLKNTGESHAKLAGAAKESEEVNECLN